jgi:uncharacterized protein DUF4372/DDE family transposase
MNTGKTLFSQLMDCLPWSTFARIVARYHGDHSVQTFPCTEQYRAMAFAQLTFRESLRDIEACLSAQPAKLLHMGFRGPVRRSTLADANEARDWRIYAEFAQRLIAQARRLYTGESLLGDLNNTVYALDSTTIDLCLSLFPWAHFRTTKAAVKMHTLLDLRGNIPSFIHISDGKLHDVHALDMILPEAGAIYVMDRGYVDFARLYGLHQAGAFFVIRAKSNLNAHRVYSTATDRTTGVIADQKIALDGHYTSMRWPEEVRASITVISVFNRPSQRSVLEKNESTLYVHSSAEEARPAYAELDEGYRGWPSLSSTLRGRAKSVTSRAVHIVSHA